MERFDEIVFIGQLRNHRNQRLTVRHRQQSPVRPEVAASTVENSRWRPAPVSGAQAASFSSCPKCRGVGYVRADVPFGHPNFGKPLPCQCRVARKNEDRRQHLRAQSQIDTLEEFREASFDNFQYWRPGLFEPYEAALQYAASPKGWFILAGESGCGKTHLAIAITKHCLEEGATALFSVVPDLLDYLRTTFAPDAKEPYDEVFRKMREVELLVLDDLGAESSTAWAREKLFQLLNHRHNARLATVITTNKIGFAGMDPRLQSRLGDRRLVRTITITQAADFRLQEPSEKFL